MYLLLLPFSWLYGFFTILIKLSYRLGLRKVRNFQLPIVVVGNLSVGGNGKTPLVIWLVNQLQKMGWKVGVISRGYAGKSNQYPILLDDTIDSSQCGDEPILIRQRTGAWVSVSPNRVDAADALIKKKSIDIIITDDGLQHYALGRNIEWVVIDGERRFGNGWWIPAGPMRERSSRLQSVNNIFVNGGKAKFGEIPIKLINSKKVINLLNNRKICLNKLKSVVVMAGIAFPSRFFSMIRSLGINPIREISFSDHQIYNKKILENLVSANEELLMTEKDAVKCRIFAKKNWWYMPVNVFVKKKYKKMILSSIDSVIKNYYKS